MRILTEELVKRAIALTAPGAEAILNTTGTTWGLRWVAGFVMGPGLAEPIWFEFGEDERWNPEWGKPINFTEVARAKLNASRREGLPTSVIAATKPWLLRRREFLYPGGTTRDGITVAVSGAKGRTDEALAEILLSTIIMLAMLEVDRRVEKKQMEI